MTMTPLPTAPSTLDPSTFAARADAFLAALAQFVTEANALSSTAVTLSGGLMTGTLGFVLGTVTAPGMYFSGDTNTGIWSPAADTLAGTVGGIEAWRVSGGGNAALTFQNKNSNTGNASSSRFFLDNGTNQAGFQLYGSLYTTSGISRQDGAILTATGAGGLTLNTQVAQPIYFGVNNSEVARFDTSGRFIIGGTAAAALEGLRVVRSANTSFAGRIENSGNSTPYGLVIQYTAAAPNDADHSFFLGTDNGVGTKIDLRSNGGVANFSANNVNLSDPRSKREIEPYTDEELDAIESALVSDDLFVKYKYNDQTHDDWNFGTTTEKLKAAFKCIPTLVDVWNPTKRVDVDGKEIIVETPEDEQLDCYYPEDLKNMIFAVTARLCKRVAQLEAR